MSKRYVLTMHDPNKGKPGWQPVYVVKCPSKDGGLTDDWQYSLKIAEATIFPSDRIARYEARRELSQRGLTAQNAHPFDSVRV